MLRELGRGAEGAVYLAEDRRRDGLPVVLKMLTVGAAASREFERLAEFRHPCLARVFDAGIYDPDSGRFEAAADAALDLPPARTPYFSSEYCEGVGLDAFDWRGRFDRFEGVLAEACRALQYLNSCGYRHGDLKPSHLIFDPDTPRLRLVDLGQVARLDERERTLGTRPYAAPELWSPLARPRRSSDLYALAMVACHVLIRRLPLQSGSLEEWRSWHDTGDREAYLERLPTDLPAPLRSVLKSCLSPDPDDRPRDAATLLRQLHRHESFVRCEDRPVPLFVGREEELSRLDRWVHRALRSPAGGVSVWAGARGNGVRRLLGQALQRWRVEGREVVEWNAVDFPRQLPSDDRCIHAVRVTSEVDPEILERIFASNGVVVVYGPLTAWVEAPPDDRFSTENSPHEWNVLGPLPPAELRSIADDLLGTPRAAQLTLSSFRGRPGALVESVESGRAPSVTPAHAYDLSPAPVPWSVIVEAEGESSEVWAAWLQDSDRASQLSGRWPSLRIQTPTVPERVAGETPSSLEESSDVWIGRDPAHWGARSLRALVEVDVPELRTLVEAKRAEAPAAIALALRAAAVLTARGKPEQAARFGWTGVEALSSAGQARDAWLQIERNRDGWAEHATPTEARVAGRVAEAYGRSDDALRWFRRAAEAVEDSESWAATVDAARLALANGDRDQARRWVERIASRESERGTADLPPAVWVQLANLADLLGAGDEAHRWYRRALAEARSGPRADLDATLHALSGLSARARRAGAPADAERFLRAGVRLARWNDAASRARHLETNLAAVWYDSGRFDEAETLYRSLLKSSMSEGNARLFPYLSQGLGTVQRDRWDLLGAVRTQLRGVRVAREQGDLRAIAGIRANLGELYLWLGDPSRAYQHRLSHLRWARRVGNPHQIRRGRVALAMVMVRCDEFEVALSLLDRSSVQAGDRVEARASFTRSEVQLLRGDLDGALRGFARAARIGRRNGRGPYRTRALVGMARVVARLGRFDRSERILDAARRVASDDAAPRISRLLIAIERLSVRFLRAFRSERIPPATWIGTAWDLAREAAQLTLPEESLRALGIAQWCIIRRSEDPRRRGPVLPTAQDDGPSREETDRLLGRFRRRLTPRQWTALVARVSPVPGTPHRGLLGVQFGGAAADAPRAPESTSEERWKSALEKLRVSLGAESVVGLVLWRGAVRCWGRATTSGVEAHPLIWWFASTQHAADDQRVEGGVRRVPFDLGSLFDASWLEIRGASKLDRLHRIDTQELRAETLVRVAAQWAQEALPPNGGRDRIPLEVLETESLETESLETEALTQRLEVRALEPVPGSGSQPPMRWIAESEAMRQLESSLDRWAKSPLPLLVWGESGVGKSAWVRRVHERSPRADLPIVIENCSALPEALLEAELFGYVRGAFTGAEQDRSGLFHRADGSTLVLDQLDEMAFELQGRLLRVLETRRYRPLGSEEEVPFDVRIVVTFGDEPGRTVETGAVRSDLFYRLNSLVVEVPSLRDRPEDVAPLLRESLAAHARREGQPAPDLDRDALALLERHAWPGNVRELQNLAQRWIVDRVRVVTPRLIEPIFSPRPEPEVGGPTSSFFFESADWREATATFQRALLELRLAENDGNQSKTAKELGLSRRHLQNLIDKLGLR